MTASTPAFPHVNLNRFFAACLSGAVAGVLIGGGVSRISMRVVALLIGGSGSFSWEGTLGILLIGGVFGVIFGGVYPLLRRFLPLRPVRQGAAYGTLWAALVCYFFVVNREGELGLIGPGAGMALFAPIPVLQGIGMAWLLGRVEGRLAGAKVRTLPAHWFAGLLPALFLAVVGMGSLVGEGLRLPPLVFNLTTRLGVNFAGVAGFHRMLGLLFIALWLGLCVLLFVRSDDNRGRLAALGLLLLAGGLFHGQPPFTGWMAGIPVGRWSSAVLSGAGAGALIALLVDGPHRSPGRAEWASAGAVGAVVLLWNGTNLRLLPLQGPLYEWLLWCAALLGLGGSAALGIARNWPHQTSRPVALAWLAAIGCFLGIWAATLLLPDWNIRGAVHPFAPLGVTVYLLPWLLPVIATVLAARRSLWAEE